MRSLVRSVLLALAAVPLLAPALAAQRGRLTVTPTFGRATTSRLMEHYFQLPDDPDGTAGYYRGRSLDVGEATVVGARIAVGVGRGWTATAEGAYGRTSLLYREVKGFPCLGVCALAGQGAFTRHDDASIATLALGVERFFALNGQGLELGIGASASLRRIGLDRLPDGTCQVGLEEPFCGPDDAWESRYWIPGAQGSLAARFRVTRTLGLEVRGALAAGRANTAGFRSGEVFHEDLGAQPIDGEPLPPARRRVHGAVYSAGLSYRP